MPKDVANTLEKAKAITVSNTVRTIKELIGGRDRYDFYQLRLNKRSILSLTLEKLRADADIALLNRQAGVIRQSRKLGRRNEKIELTLNSGVYYLRITPHTKRDKTSYQLRLIATEASNTAPRLEVNMGLKLQRGEAVAIDQNQLQAVDLEQTAQELTYTITSLPSHGRLELNGTSLQVGEQFTQADLINQRLRYVHTGKISQLTNNSTRDLAAGISGTSITWNSFADNATETTATGTSATVFFYNASTGQTTALSSTSSLNFASGISGSRVAWTGLNTFGLPKVFLSNGETQATTPLTSGILSFGAAPVISDTNVAWTGITTTGSEIFFYNATTGQTTQLTNTATTNEVAVSVFDSNVLYNTINTEDQPQEVFLYKGSTGQSIQLSNGSNRNSAIGVSGTKVAWNGFDGNDYEIFMYDIATGKITAITDNTVDDVAPITTGLSGSNVVWNQLSADGQDSNVFLYNGTTNQVSQLTNSSTTEIGISISGFNVIWSTFDKNQALEVFFYNGLTGITTQLTNNATADFGVSVSGSRVVWNGFDGNDFEVFLADLESISSTDSFSFSVTDGIGTAISSSFSFGIS